MSSLSGFFIDKKDGSLNGRFYVLLYFILTHVFFYKFLVPGQMIFGTDIQNQSYPLQHMAVGEMLKGRSIMLWNPYIFSGMPFLASFSFPVFYPMVLLFFILPLGFAMGYEVLLHFFLMGVFMYLFLRRLKLSRQASFVGGLIFMFNAHFISLIYPGHGSKLFTMTYLPLALMFLDRALEERPFYNMSVMGLMVGLMFYAGHVQILFYCGITLLLFLLVRLALDARVKGGAWALKSSAGFCYAFALAVLLYAVILFPAMEYRGYTHRAGGMTGAATYEFATSFSQPPEDMSYFFLRNPFGWGKDYGPNVPTTKDIFYRGRIGLRLSIDYLSVFGLVLAFIGAALNRNRYTWYFTGLALLAAFLAMGGFNPFYVYVYKYVPGFSIFRVPYAILILMPLCCGALAAFGLQYLLDAKAAKTGKGIVRLIVAGATLAVVAFALAIYWKSDLTRSANWFLSFNWVREMLWGDYSDIFVRLSFFIKNVLVFAALLSASMLALVLYRLGVLKTKYMAAFAVLFILADLWPVGWEFIKTVPVNTLESVYFRELPEIKTMEEDTSGPFRVYSMVTNNELMYRGIQSLTGYHAVPLGYYERALERIDFQNSILDLLNAKYLMLPKEPDYDFANYPVQGVREALGKKYELLANGDFFFYKERNPSPRAFLVNNLYRVENADAALDVISDPLFKPGMGALVSEDVDTGGMSPRSDLSGQSAQVTLYTPDTVVYDVIAPSDSFMVASEIWYPGWKAYVDGKETKVYRTDYLLRGMVMPKGAHKVVMEFKPGIFRLSAAISIAALLYLALIICWPYIKKRWGLAK